MRSDFNLIMKILNLFTFFLIVLHKFCKLILIMRIQIIA